MSGANDPAAWALANRFRFQPPEGDELVPRRRVQRALRARRDGRVVVLTAGPGFGKTTALAIAAAEGRLDPDGEDVWLACVPADQEASSLLAGLAVAMGGEGAATVDDVLALVARRSPRRVGLLLDDVHVIPRASGGAEALSDLIERLPPHAGVAMAGRAEPPVALARLASQGRVVTVDESQLTLTPDELRDLGLEGAESSGGWPALVALARRAGRLSDYVWEEVVSALGPRDRDRLATLVALGRAEGWLLDELSGPEEDLALDQLPLVHRRGPELEAHSLWEERVDALDTPAGVDRRRVAALDALIGHGRPGAAVDVALRGVDGDHLDRALRAALTAFETPPAPALHAWREALAGRPASPAIALARGLAARDDDPASLVAIERFEAAADGFQAADDPVGETVARAQIIACAYSRGEPALALPQLPRLVELAPRDERASAIALLGQAAVTVTLGDPEGAREVLARVPADDLPTELRNVADYFDFAVATQLGHDACDVADRLSRLPRELPGATESFASSRIRAGRLDELRPLLDEEPPDGIGTRATHQWAVWRLAAAVLLGRPDVARRRWATAEATLPEAGNARFYAEIAQIALAAGDGSRQQVRAELDRVLEQHPMAAIGAGPYALVAGVVAWLRPDQAAHWDRDRMGPMLRRDLDLAAALVAAEEGDLRPMAMVAWPESAGALAAALLPMGAGLFLAAAHAAGRPEAEKTTAELFAALGPYGREQVARWRSHPDPRLGDAAARLCRTVPAPPAEERRLGLLGPTTLSIGATESSHPDLRRERVRSLLAYLVVHRRTTRDAVIAALWPDADEGAGRRRLRTTLNRLLGVLEPERGPGAAPWFVRSFGESVELEPRGLVVDTDTFEAQVAGARALDDDGLLSDAADAYRSAAGWYRGPFLADAAWDDWSATVRHRLQELFVASATRGAQLLAGRGDHEAASALAARVIEVEPWSERAHAVAVRSRRALGDEAGARRAARRALDALEEVGGPSDAGLARELLASAGPGGSAPTPRPHDEAAEPSPDEA
ncbi:MAG: hypothetical protein H6518_12950 [Microthrixaceae bacterium]|nr:hypothetical protein [Microthrixaceae bacterium]